MKKKIRRVEQHCVRWRPEVWDRIERLAKKAGVSAAEIANNSAWVYKRDELENIAERKKELARQDFFIHEHMRLLEEYEKAAIEAKEKQKAENKE